MPEDHPKVPTGRVQRDALALLDAAVAQRRAFGIVPLSKNVFFGSLSRVPFT